MFYKIMYNDDTLLEKLRETLTYYPHLLAKAEMLWTEKQMLVQFIRQLILDTRDNTRKGFPESTLHELMKIHNHYAKDQLFIHRDYE